MDFALKVKRSVHIRLAVDVGGGVMSKDRDIDKESIVKEKNKRYRENNPEKMKESRKKWRESNTNKIKEYAKKWRENNIEKVRKTSKKWAINNSKKAKEIGKKWREDNPKRIKELSKKYYEKNLERIKEKNKEWCKNNIDRKKKLVKMWQKNNPDRIRDYCRKRRALRKGTFSENIDEKQVYEKYNWLCQICYKKIKKNLKWPNPMSISIDHIIPLAKGGNHILNNVQPAHLICNISKGDRIFEILREAKIYEEESGLLEEDKI